MSLDSGKSGLNLHLYQLKNLSTSIQARCNVRALCAGEFRLVERRRVRSCTPCRQKPAPMDKELVCS
jgi:hypothetical protein